MQDELEKYRKIISSCDQEIVKLLHQRAEAAIEIGRHKQAQGAPFYDASRQKEVLRAVLESGASGPFPQEGLREVFSEIMSACLAMERPTRIGYLGPPGTYSHQAAKAEFGSKPDLKPYPNFSDIFDAVDRQWVDYGIVPIENSTNGIVHYVLDLFLEHELTICGEIIIPVHHCLISNTSLDKIKRIYSHAQGLQQCQLWLRRNLPGAERIEVSSTTAGVTRANEEENAAAIGSELAAEIYSMDILVNKIEDMKKNFTRFLTIAKEPAKPSEHDKTSLMFSVHDKPGALVETLKYFSDGGINLTKIENRPSKRRLWDYVFFVDLIGHHQEPNIAKVMAKLQSECTFFKLLGSYPRDIDQNGNA
jgi:chorismate mutase/prephenate dehydratase